MPQNYVWSRFQAPVLFLLCPLLVCAIGFAATPDLCPSSLGGQTVERESAYADQFKDLVRRDRDFVKALRAEPASTYLNLRAAAHNALGATKRAKAKTVDFPFAPHRPIVERIVMDLSMRLTRKYGEKHKAKLTAAKKRAEKLLEKGNPPYKKTIRFVMYEYLPALNAVLEERHPELAQGNFHEKNAKNQIESMLSKAPDLLFYFSFAAVDEDFFTDTRPALMNLIGINLEGLDDVSEPPYGDFFFMKNSEFSYHDIGHAEFTSMRDLQYLDADKKPIERIVWEWEVTRRRLNEVISQIRNTDSVLAESMKAILFEVLRERGFQFSLTVLKQELETPKWTRVLLKKFKKGFYNHYGTNPKKFERLEEARAFLVKAIERYKEMDQISWIQTVRAHIVPSQITHTPSLQFAEGRLHEIEIPKLGSVLIRSESQEGSVETTQIGELISAQVDATESSPLTATVLEKISHVLAQETYSAVVVKPNRSLWVLDVKGQEIPFDAITLSAEEKRPARLTNIEIFKINQVLGTEERSEHQQFTIRRPTEVFVGTVHVNQNLVTGMHTATVRTLDGRILEFPLVELRIDPL